MIPKAIPHLSTGSFEPLSIEALVAFPPETAMSIARALLKAKDHARLLALLPHLSLCSPDDPYDPSSFDDDFCGALLTQATEPLLSAIADRFSAATLLHAGHRTLDFGPLATRCAIAALDFLAQGLPLERDAYVDRVLALCSRPSIVLSAEFDRDDSFSFLPQLQHDFDDLGLHDYLFYNYMSLSAPAIALAERGEPRLLEALLAREDFKTLLHNKLHDDADAGTWNCLTCTDFWLDSFAIGERLLQEADRSKPIHPAILRTLITAALDDENRVDERLAALLDRLAGLGFLRDSAPFSDDVQDAFASGTKFLASDARHAQALRLALASFLHTSHSSKIRGWVLCHALFDAQPGLYPIAQGAFSDAYGAEHRAKRPRPEREAFASALSLQFTHTAYIHSLSQATRPESVALGLDALGLAHIEYFTVARRGREHSLLMLFVKNANLASFEAALDWFASKGALQEQSQVKAWVHYGSDTRKIGDLLACCVAEGKPGYAKALIERLPKLDRKYARDTAKALSAKAADGVGPQALSAWESVLLSKILAVSTPGGAPAPARKSRSL